MTNIETKSLNDMNISTKHFKKISETTVSLIVHKGHKLARGEVTPTTTIKKLTPLVKSLIKQIEKSKAYKVKKGLIENHANFKLSRYLNEGKFGDKDSSQVIAHLVEECFEYLTETMPMKKCFEMADMLAQCRVFLLKC